MYGERARAAQIEAFKHSPPGRTRTIGDLNKLLDGSYLRLAHELEKCARDASCERARQGFPRSLDVGVKLLLML